MARLTAQRMNADGRAVVVENHPEANGAIGAEVLASAKMSDAARANWEQRVLAVTRDPAVKTLLEAQGMLIASNMGTKAASDSLAKESLRWSQFIQNYGISADN